MRTIKFVLAFIFLFYGCMNNNAPRRYLDENDGLYLLSQENNLLNLTPVAEYFPDGYNGYIYVMNSECSDCIATFISFAEKLNTTGYCGNLLVVISAATQPIVNHYIKEYDFSKNINITLSENKHGKWGVGSIEEETGKVYVITNDIIEKAYLYSLY